MTKKKHKWQKFIRMDGRIEYNCEHGVGHGAHVHGCCGCCSRDDFPLKKELDKWLKGIKKKETKSEYIVIKSRLRKHPTKKKRVYVKAHYRKKKQKIKEEVWKEIHTQLGEGYEDDLINKAMDLAIEKTAKEIFDYLDEHDTRFNMFLMAVPTEDVKKIKKGFGVE